MFKLGRATSLRQALNKFELKQKGGSERRKCEPPALYKHGANPCWVQTTVCNLEIANFLIRSALWRKTPCQFLKDTLPFRSHSINVESLGVLCEFLLMMTFCGRLASAFLDCCTTVAPCSLQGICGSFWKISPELTTLATLRPSHTAKPGLPNVQTAVNL